MSLGKFAEGGREHARAGNRLKYCRSSSVPRHQRIAPLTRALAPRDAGNRCCVVRSQYCRNRVGPATMPVAWRAALSTARTFRAPLEQATQVAASVLGTPLAVAFVVRECVPKISRLTHICQASEVF